MIQAEVVRHSGDLSAEAQRAKVEAATADLTPTNELRLASQPSRKTGFLRHPNIPGISLAPPSNDCLVRRSQKRPPAAFATSQILHAAHSVGAD
jgi:hypothetical protein